ncbi:MULTISPECIES: hypothetical protein [Bradyrhizobium]|nr:MULTISPECIES: hypothetical protein [Bradyrhizobium]
MSKLIDDMRRAAHTPEDLLQLAACVVDGFIAPSGDAGIMLRRS